MLIQAAINKRGQKPPKLPPWPRPVTEVDRARERRRMTAHKTLVQRVLHPSRRKG